MSRIGKKPIVIPDGVTAKLSGQALSIKGPKGELTENVHPLVKVEITGASILLTVENAKDKFQRALWGLWGSLIKNMVIGATIGFAKKLEVNGVGFKVSLQGDKLILNLGFSHPVTYVLPKEVQATVEKNIISLTSTSKQILGETAAQIRRLKEPEPYKGKGIKYSDEIIKRKAGKAAAKKE